METEALKLASSQGPYAVLFVALLFYVLRTNEKREDRMLQALDKLGKAYEDMSREVGLIREDVSEMKDKK